MTSDPSVFLFSHISLYFEGVTGEVLRGHLPSVRVGEGTGTWEVRVPEGIGGTRDKYRPHDCREVETLGRFPTVKPGWYDPAVEHRREEQSRQYLRGHTRRVEKVGSVGSGHDIHTL